MVKKGAGGETLYINPWYVAALGRNSKRIFAGTTRIVTKLEISPTGEGYGPGAKNLKEVAQYFYHQDHLGSTGFATNATGEVWQHLEYFPFGETWVDEVSDDTRVPYRFTGQELDQETKLYYYGARYYDPRTSAWESPDPALGKYLNAGKAKFSTPSLALNWRSRPSGAGMGGISEPKNLGLYTYAHSNPANVINPDGLRDVDVHIWRAEGGAVGHVMVTEANSKQVILSQFPHRHFFWGRNQTKDFAQTMAAEGHSASEVWRVYVPDDKAFDQTAAHERSLPKWSWDPGKETTQCSIAASRALEAGGVKINTMKEGTLMPGFFANNLEQHKGPDIRRIPIRTHQCSRNFNNQYIFLRELRERMPE